MEFKVVPFNANLKRDDASQEAPTKGCLGFGAKPGFVTSVAVAVFRKN